MKDKFPLPACVVAYGAANGLKSTLADLLASLEKEDLNKHGLIELGDGAFVSRIDTRKALNELVASHTRMATLVEVVQDLYDPEGEALPAEED